MRHAGSGAIAPFPRLRLRAAAAPLLELPWELPLARWPAHDRPGPAFVDLGVGPSRHLVRFLVVDGRTYALKEEPAAIAAREFAVLRRLEDAGLPAVRALGLVDDLRGDRSILVTEYLQHSMQYRRLLLRMAPGPGGYRERLLDAMALLMVDLHRGGVWWGDCSLANTLFRRDGDRMQAYLVDAETSEVHDTLTDGQRAHDLDILVENVAFGLADLALLQDRPQDVDAAPDEAAGVLARYEAVWAELHDEPEADPGDRQAIRARLRRLNDLGFTADLDVGPGDPGPSRLRTAVTTRHFHARELERRTRVRALEGQARMLLNDLHEHHAWLEHRAGRRVPDAEAVDRWLRGVYRPTLARIADAVGPDRDLVQAYCDVLEHKWLRSEAVGEDVGLQGAIASYLAAGAPAPEGGPAITDLLDINDGASERDGPGV